MNNNHKYFLIVFLLVYPLLFAFQGLDFTDMGFVLTNQYQIFHDPSSVHYRFFTWLSNLIGGGIVTLTDPYGIVSSRLATVLSYYIIMYCVYLVLKDTISTQHILFGLALSVMFIIKDTGTWLNYNKLTALFFIGAITLLFKGGINRQKSMIFGGALLLGLNVFVRLPNLLGISFILSGLFLYWLNKQYKILPFVTTFLIGFAAGIAICIILLKYFGQYDLFFTSLHEYIAMKNTSTSSHSTGSLIILLLRDYSLSAVIGIGTITIFALTVYAGKQFRQGFRYLLYTIIIGAVSLILPKGDLWKWAFFVPILLPLILYVINMRNSSEKIRLAALFSIILMVIVPLGSNNGVYNSIYGMWLAIPISTHFLLTLKRPRFKNWALNENEFHDLKILLMGVTVLVSVIIGYRGTYRDSNNRFRMSSVVESPRLSGVFTTQKRAQVTKELLDILPQYIKPGEYLLAYDGLALIYYLTETRPYLANPWPLLYSPKYLKNELFYAEEHISYLPVVVRPKGSTFNSNWPYEISPYRSTYAQRREIINNFIRQYGYVVVWQNDFFEILCSE